RERRVVDGATEARDLLGARQRGANPLSVARPVVGAQGTRLGEKGARPETPGAASLSHLDPLLGGGTGARRVPRRDAGLDEDGEMIALPFQRSVVLARDRQAALRQLERFTMTGMGQHARHVVERPGEGEGASGLLGDLQRAATAG